MERDPVYDMIVVLPDLVDPKAELSAEALEAVAGGQKTWCDCGATQCC